MDLMLYIDAASFSLVVHAQHVSSSLKLFCFFHLRRRAPNWKASCLFHSAPHSKRRVTLALDGSTSPREPTWRMPLRA